MYSLYKQAGFYLLALLMSACSDGDGTPVFGLGLKVAAVGVNNLQFSWSAYNGATFYQLYVNPDGTSGFTQVGTDITATSTDVEIPVHLTDWINASYFLEAHDANGKLDTSSAVTITDLMLSTIGYVKASNTGADDAFGFSVSISDNGSTLAVGATGEDGTAIDEGAVYVFTRSGATWNQQAYVKASNPAFQDNFGNSVSLSSDGSTLAVGANLEDNTAADEGAVYVFTRSGTTWNQQAHVKASNAALQDNFGNSISLSGDGNTLAVGANLKDSTAADEGAVYVFTRSGTNWTEQAYLKAATPAANDYFGNSVSLSTDGNTLAVGANGEDAGTATDAGAAYIFSPSGTWSQQAHLKATAPAAGDNFGYSISLDNNGTTLAIGANGEDDGTATDAGAAYIFALSSSWNQQAHLKASNAAFQDNFGTSVSLSSDGNTLAVGAVGEAGNAIGVGGDETNDAAGNAGAVYVFSYNAGWNQRAYVKASNTDADDNFGTSTSLSNDGSKLVVGATGESSSVTGINGDQTIDTELNAGAVYIY